RLATLREQPRLLAAPAGLRTQGEGRDDPNLGSGPPRTTRMASTSNNTVMHFGHRDHTLEDLKHEELYDDHSIPLTELCARLGTDLDVGLDEVEARRRLQESGPNALPRIPPKAWWRLLLKHVFGAFSVLLWVAAVLCIVCYLVERNAHPDTPQDNLFLGVLILIIIAITSEKRSADIIAAFQKMLRPSSRVLRGGRVRSVSSEALVVGDVVHLAMGDCVPADIRVVESSGCKLDASTLTGESDPVSVTTVATDNDPHRSSNMAFFSNTVVEGFAKGVVIRGAPDSTVGRIAELTAKIEPGDTALDKDINSFLRGVAYVSLVANIVIFVAAMALGYTWLDSTIFVLGMLVATIPEGLPLTVSVCMSLAAKRMAGRNCMVKDMEAVVTMGFTSVICSDKTGTLTQNKMTVVRVWWEGRGVHAAAADLPAADSDPGLAALVQVAMLTGTGGSVTDGASTVAALCNRAQLTVGPGANGGKAVGDASEVAILKFIEARFGGVYETRQRYAKVYEEPFNSSKKYQLSVHELPGGRHLVAVKGAPERVLEMCDRVRARGREEPQALSAELHAEVHDACEAMAEQGQRVLAFARSTIDDKTFTKGFKFTSKNVPRKNLVFVGLMALEDPPRETVPDAVAKCRRAGIKVVMITGDHPTTAKSIAKEKIASDVARAKKVPVAEVRAEDAACLLMTGPEIADYTKDMLAVLLNRFPEICFALDILSLLRIFRRQIVFARTSPTQKLMIVESFQSLGHIVAVTGDGVNDSPALKKADVGVAMGITGTDVSKDAADMILLDDNFSSIVAAVEQGRVVSDNLQKSIAYVLTSNAPEIVPFQVVLAIPLPLSIALVLVIDAVTDLWPSISLAYEQPEENVMRREPRDPYTHRLVSGRLLAAAYLQVGGVQAAAALVSYYIVFIDNGFSPGALVHAGPDWDDPDVVIKDAFGREWSEERRRVLHQMAQTATFLAIVWTQIADLLMCRCRRDSLLSRGCTNWQLNSAVASQIALMCIVIYVEDVGYFLRVRPLPLVYWTPALVFSLLMLATDELRRRHIRRHPGGWDTSARPGARPWCGVLPDGVLRVPKITKYTLPRKSKRFCSGYTIISAAEPAAAPRRMGPAAEPSVFTVSTLKMYKFLLIVGFASLASAADYCSTVGVNHTMCLYPTTTPGKACKNFKANALTAADRAAVLKAHNELRNKVALGKESRGITAQPAAANMRKMVWDNELATIAQRWANQCTFAHDKNRNTLDRTYNGQNIFWEASSATLPSPNWAKAVQEWYDEVDDRNGEDNVQGFSNPGGPVIGHYTQVVWAKTNRVGCGYADYSAVQGGRNWNARLVVCNYKPGGNFIGERMYEAGSPASQCPSGTKRDSTYTGAPAQPKLPPTAGPGPGPQPPPPPPPAAPDQTPAAPAAPERRADNSSTQASGSKAGSDSQGASVPSSSGLVTAGGGSGGGGGGGRVGRTGASTGGMVGGADDAGGCGGGGSGGERICEPDSHCDSGVPATYTGAPGTLPASFVPWKPVSLTASILVLVVVAPAWVSAADADGGGARVQPAGPWAGDAAVARPADALPANRTGSRNYYSYCDICHDHTLCRYYTQGACGGASVSVSRPLQREEQDEVVAAHNTVRWILATGEEARGSPGPQPAAANMRLMWYDDELAAIAQRWADQCQFRHDSCRNVERFAVGQNIYLERMTRPLKRPDWNKVVRKWYDEVAKHSGRQSLRPYRFSAVTGHFTQLSWADTFLVGCGIAEYNDYHAGRRWNTRLYVCNYGPAGNVVGGWMYVAGEACAHCGPESYCYYGLC
ncbi:Sodium/potassium-transporting ATPase subunit alpha, partial [Frankliniella fusca]